METMIAALLSAALLIDPTAAFIPRSPGRKCTPLLHSPAGRSPSSSRAGTTLSAAAPTLEAILFDCDGVLADTERDGHRLAFNLAFKDQGINDNWTEERYGALLAVGGGKERMTAHWVSFLDYQSFLVCENWGLKPTTLNVVCEPVIVIWEI